VKVSMEREGKEAVFFNERILIKGSVADRE